MNKKSLGVIWIFVVYIVQVVGVITNKVVPSTIMAIVLMYILIANISACSKVPSLFVFVTSFFVMIPFNIYMSHDVMKVVGCFEKCRFVFLTQLTFNIIFSIILITVEGLILLGISRVLWPNQYIDENIGEFINYRCEDEESD